MRPWTLLLAMASVPYAFGQVTLDLAIGLDKPEAGGVVRVALCPDADAYRSDRGCVVRAVAANAAVVHCYFEDLDMGAVAVKVFHDVNGNGALDTNWFGLPSEPYGFGNNAPVRFGPPPFDQTLIRLNGATTASLTLKGG